MKVVCPYCGSKKVMRRGTHPKQRYQCTDSRHPDRTSRYFYNEETVARVLLFDIETLPMEFYGWALWDKITSPDFIIRDWCVLSYAAKWLFEPKNTSSILTPKEAVAHDDRRIVDEVWKLFDQADVIIAHNGMGFDVPRMNTRFVLHDMLPPSSYQQVDTFKTAQRAFGFSSNKLDYLGQYLGLGKKHHTEFQLWKDCASGDKSALAEMKAYNERDIYLLEDVYVRLRPWIQHPNMGLYVTSDEPVCPRCGGVDLKSGGTYTTNAGVFNAFRCENCGAIGRHKTRIHSTTLRVV